MSQHFTSKDTGLCIWFQDHTQTATNLEELTHLFGAYLGKLSQEKIFLQMCWHASLYQMQCVSLSSRKLKTLIFIINYIKMSTEVGGASIDLFLTGFSFNWKMLLFKKKIGWNEQMNEWTTKLSLHFISSLEMSDLEASSPNYKPYTLIF